MNISIPGYKDLSLNHLVLDYNGTMALDGIPIPGVEGLLKKLADELTIHVITADTFGTVQEALLNFPCKVLILKAGNQQNQKKDYILELGAESVAAIGNGRNDQLMLEQAVLGMIVNNGEGLSTETLMKADLMTHSIHEALELLLYPNRLVATLRS